MTEHEESLRRERQDRALTIHGKGSLIEAEYYNRTTKVVPVNEADLRDLMGLDGVELGLMTVGQFMGAGALWLFLDRYSAADFQWTGVAGFCVAAFIFGVVMIGAALGIRLMKRRKIARMFSDATPSGG